MQDLIKEIIESSGEKISIFRLLNKDEIKIISELFGLVITSA
jgi:hypothetical protein